MYTNKENTKRKLANIKINKSFFHRVFSFKQFSCERKNYSDENVNTAKKFLNEIERT